MRPSSSCVKRVLLLVDTLNLGGTETQLVNTAIRLNSDSYQVTVGCLRAEGPLLQTLRQAGIQIVEFRKEKTLLSLNGLYQLFRLIKFLHRGKFHVLHAYDLWANLLGIPAARLARVPVIISSRRYLADHDWYTTRRNKILRFLYRMSTHVVVNSISVRELLVKRDKIARRRIRVIYNAIEADRFACSRRKKIEKLPNICANSKIIAVLANLYAVKGHAHLITAATTVCASHPGTVFLLIGDGPERVKLQQMVKELGLEKNVLFLGCREDVPELLACCDLSVLASESEALPNSVLETMAAGLPIVATRVGGITEVVQDGVNGVLVPPNNAEALARAISRLLRNPECAAKLGSVAQERVRRDFSFQRLISQTKQLYDGSDNAVTLEVARLPPSQSLHKRQPA